MPEVTAWNSMLYGEIEGLIPDNLKPLFAEGFVNEDIMLQPEAERTKALEQPVEQTRNGPVYLGFIPPDSPTYLEEIPLNNTNKEDQESKLKAKIYEVPGPQMFNKGFLNWTNYVRNPELSHNLYPNKRIENQYNGILKSKFNKRQLNIIHKLNNIMQIHIVLLAARNMGSAGGKLVKNLNTSLNRSSQRSINSKGKQTMITEQLKILRNLTNANKIQTKNLYTDINTSSKPNKVPIEVYNYKNNDASDGIVNTIYFGVEINNDKVVPGQKINSQISQNTSFSLAGNKMDNEQLSYDTNLQFTAPYIRKVLQKQTIHQTLQHTSAAYKQLAELGFDTTILSAPCISR